MAEEEGCYGPIETLGVSGHRPKEWGYDLESYAFLKVLVKIELARLKPKEVITGMALGMDTACAEACYELGIPFIALVPWSKQNRLWKQEDREKYDDLLSKASSVKVLSDDEEYDPRFFTQRNTVLVENSDFMLMLWSGRRGGGTHDAHQKAEGRGLRKINLYESFLTRKLEENLAYKSAGF